MKAFRATIRSIVAVIALLAIIGQPVYALAACCCLPASGADQFSAPTVERSCCQHHQAENAAPHSNSAPATPRPVSDSCHCCVKHLADEAIWQVTVDRSELEANPQPLILADALPIEPSKLHVFPAFNEHPGPSTQSLLCVWRK